MHLGHRTSRKLPEPAIASDKKTQARQRVGLGRVYIYKRRTSFYSPTVNRAEREGTVMIYVPLFVQFLTSNFFICYVKIQLRVTCIDWWMTQQNGPASKCIKLRMMQNLQPASVCSAASAPSRERRRILFFFFPFKIICLVKAYKLGLARTSFASS